MKEKIKYCQNAKIEDCSFSFDRVHVVCNEQITVHQQNTWELSYVITGSGQRMIGDRIETFSAGEVILIPPNIPHYWTFSEKFTDSEGKIENITIEFSNVFLKKCKNTFPELLETVLTLQKITNAIAFSGETLQKIQQTLISMTTQNMLERLASFILLFDLISQQKDGNNVGNAVVNDDNINKLKRVELYVMNHFQHEIRLEDIARFAGFGKSGFCVFFRKMTDKTFFAYLTEFRIKSACQMLQTTNLSVSEICFLCGFRDLPYFNRTFRKIKGMTPTAFRRLFTRAMN